MSVTEVEDEESSFSSWSWCPLICLLRALSRDFNLDSSCFRSSSIIMTHQRRSVKQAANYETTVWHKVLPRTIMFFWVIAWWNRQYDLWWIIALCLRLTKLFFYEELRCFVYCLWIPKTILVMLWEFCVTKKYQFHFESPGWAYLNFLLAGFQISRHLSECWYKDRTRNLICC